MYLAKKASLIGLVLAAAMGRSLQDIAVAESKKQEQPKQQEVKQVTLQNKVSDAIQQIRAMNGQRIGDGQCYALAGHYAWLLDGKDISYSNGHSMRGVKGDTLSASNIATGWDWTGWDVKYDPQVQDYKVGQIFTINSNFGGIWHTGPYGHVGVITGVGGGRIETVEANRGGNLTVSINNFDINEFNQGVNYVITPK